MPKFTTVSPTCLSGGKPDAWDKFRVGGYVAIGWCYDTDLTGRSIESILELVSKTSSDERDAIDGMRSFPIFWELCERGSANAGDMVAVKNTNDGLFGIGIVRSGYKYSNRKHNTGVEGHFYPHYFDVEWLHTDYIRRVDLDFKDEQSWAPFGTFGQLYDDVPDYIRRIIVAPEFG